MACRCCPALIAMREEANRLWPNRDKASDGCCGDAAHAARKSDHNPDADGMATAYDLDHDDTDGFDGFHWSEQIRLRRDPRVKYCLVPGTRVLCADLTWRPIESLNTRDELIAFDEHGRRRTGVKGHAGALMRTATVEATTSIVRPCYELVTDRGTVVSSADHLWLQARVYEGTYRRWQRTEDLGEGDLIQHFADPWDVETSFDAGWLAGLFDGEGCLSRATAPSGWHLSLAQRPGPVLDQAIAILDTLKFRAVPSRNGSVTALHIRGGLPQTLRALGSIPTQRLGRKATTERIWEGRRIDGRWPVATVQSVRPIGDEQVTALQTSTRTLIAEGMFSHNCIFFGRMFASYATPGRPAWTWGPYTGPNAHKSHMHVSVLQEAKRVKAPWFIDAPNQEDDFMAALSDDEQKRLAAEIHDLHRVFVHNRVARENDQVGPGHDLATPILAMNGRMGPIQSLLQRIVAKVGA